MNKCANFHKDSPSDKKVKFNLPSVIELSETADFVYNFVWKPYANEQLRWNIWPIFPWNFLMKFSQKMPLYFFYSRVQTSQNDPKLKSGGFCLKASKSERKKLWRLQSDQGLVSLQSVDTLGKSQPMVGKQTLSRSKKIIVTTISCTCTINTIFTGHLKHIHDVVWVSECVSLFLFY